MLVHFTFPWKRTMRVYGGAAKTLRAATPYGAVPLARLERATMPSPPQFVYAVTKPFETSGPHEAFPYGPQHALTSYVPARAAGATASATSRAIATGKARFMTGVSLVTA